MRRPFIAGNWKMHKTTAEAVKLARDLARSLSGESVRIMIAPPFTALMAVGEALRGTSILLGAQNMGPEEQGAHTGEISVLMLKDLGVSTVILGHSERRHGYGETDALINRKLLLALRDGLEAILCVGETLKQREDGVTTRVVQEQLEKGLAGVGVVQLRSVTIAYEPVWAIGTGKNATPTDADEVHRFLRETLVKLYGAAAAQEAIIQYGGSVKPGNAAELMGMDNIDGLLVGGASLEADSFVKIVQSAR